MVYVGWKVLDTVKGILQRAAVTLVMCMFPKKQPNAIAMQICSLNQVKVNFNDRCRAQPWFFVLPDLQAQAQAQLIHAQCYSSSGVGK